MRFTKMEGCGNDYVYVNCFEENIENASELAIRVSDRHFGIGSDGLILVCPSTVADVRMEMYNADGSQSAMCGNGIRCVGKLAYECGLVSREEITVETLAGVKRLKLSVSDHEVTEVTVCMGAPRMDAASIPVVSTKDPVINDTIELGTKTLTMTCVNMGNPHAIFFCDDPKSVDLERIGPLCERHKRFPELTNVEFVRVISSNHIEMRVWERGTGETLACGTGACAAAYAAYVTGRTDASVTVSLLGGELMVTYHEADGVIYMTGPARIVFKGEWKDDEG